MKNSAAAKAALVTKYKSRPGPEDAGIVAKAAERTRLHEARLVRQADKERERQEHAAAEAEALRLRDEQALAAAHDLKLALEAEEQANQAARRERATMTVSKLADQKTTRDERYAARKARQKGARKG